VASHWICITDFVVYPHTGSVAYITEMSIETLFYRFIALCCCLHCTRLVFYLFLCRCINCICRLLLNEYAVHAQNNLHDYLRNLALSKPFLNVICCLHSTSNDFFWFFWYSAVHNSRSMTPITWQAAVDDEEQRPQLQDIFEAAIDGNHV